MSSKQNEKNIRFAVISIDVACFRIINNELCMLIGKAPKTSPFPGQWALIGGMILLKETAEDAVGRLLYDKAGIKNIYKEQVHTFSGVNRDPRGRVVSVGYLALTHIDPQDISKAKLETKWCSVKNLPKLAYDHDEIKKYTLKSLRVGVQNNDLSKYLLPKEFTLSELQSVHEAVVGEKTDKRNFRKRVLSQKVLKDTKKKRKLGVMRPAILYSFK